MNTEIIQLITLLRQQAQASRQRHCVMLSGDSKWSRALAETVKQTLSIKQFICLSNQKSSTAEQLPIRQANKLLGRETELLIYDAHGGFDADALGASSGTVRGGGLLLLLTPPLKQWPSLPDAEAQRFFQNSNDSPYLKRLIQCAKIATGVTLIEQDKILPQIPTETMRTATEPSVNTLCRTRDQQHAVDAILKVATGHRRRPAVLISDRGRGKSSALGIAAGTLLQHGLQRIIVTGPRLNATTPVFEQAGQVLAASHRHRGQLACDDGVIEYAAPDELVAEKPNCDLLLVDEAAAIPLPLLSQLLEHYPRVVFATTVHGYEGTGRSFSLKFYDELDRLTPGWQKVRLNTPIRWADHDPLEKFIFDALLLNAGLAEDVEQIESKQCNYRQIERDELLNNPQCLSQLFALLVLAHYRTRPNDLRQLLDSPDLTIYIAEYKNKILGVALLAKEGELDASLAKAIYRGERRPQGHLIPQSLAVHAGLLEATRLSYGRIMRIAIHPSLQGRGIGTALLDQIKQQATKFDCLGTSFGVTQTLYNFWQQVGFSPARIGINKEQSSGSHSLIMLWPISKAGHGFCQTARTKMHQQLLSQLSESLQTFDAGLALTLLMQNRNSEIELADDEWRDIASFAYSSRGYDFCLPVIQVLVKRSAGDIHWKKLDQQQQKILIMKVLQRQSWAGVVKKYRLNGRIAAIKLLRETLAKLLPCYCKKEQLDSVRSSFKD